MKLHRASTPAPVVEPQTYNGAQFDAPVHMTKAWARVTLLLSIGLLALGAGVAGAVYISPVALGAGAIVGLPFVVFGGIMAAYTRATHRMIYPTAPKSQVVTPRAAPPPEPAGHVVTVQREGQEPVEYVLPDIAPPKGAPNLVHFPVCANDVLSILDGLKDGRQVAYPRATLVLPSGARIAASEAGRETWRAVQDGFIAWQFAEARTGVNGREVWLRADLTIEQMKHLVRQGAGVK